MRRLLVFLLMVALFLCGCSQSNPTETEPTDIPTIETTTAPVRQPSLYDPEHPIEKRTRGAVRAYTLDDDCSGIAFMGSQLLLFSYDGFGPTRLVALNPEDYSAAATVELMGKVLPEVGGMQVTPHKLGYYSDLSNEIIILDNSLREIGRTQLPGNLTGLPLMSPDLQEAYYCTGTDIRTIDLDSGISRLLRQRSCQQVDLLGTCMDGSILVYRVTESENSTFIEFITTDSGQTVGEDAQLQAISFWKDRYYLQRQEGILTELIFGSAETPAMCIVPKADAGLIQSVLPLGALVGISEVASGSTVLQMYDLESGTMRAKISLTSLSGVHAITPDPSGKYLWFLAPDAQGYKTLYRWEIAQSETDNPTVYTTPRYTASNPDQEGLNACRTRANELEQQYGIKLHLQQDLVATVDYSFTYEYQVAAINYAMDMLEETLAVFPEDFLRRLGQVSNDGTLHIGILRDLNGRSNSVPRLTDGAQYWLGGNAHIALAIGDGLPSAFYRELAHVLDTYVLNEALAFDDWHQYNPKDFLYDENYAAYQNREDSPWLEGEEQAFINSFAMSFAREDRALIFQYAMEPGNEVLFQSPYLQQKLVQVCKGIRHAYDWKKDPRVFPWEQYLAKPLAYQK